MKLSIEATPVFDRCFHSTGRIVVHRGGTRSGKTYSVCQQLILWLLTGQIRANQRIDKGRGAVVRKYQTTLRHTVEHDFISICMEMDVYKHIAHNKTNKAFTYADREVVFIGADDQQKLRGFQCDILYCNEGNELAYDREFFQLFIRTRHLTIIDLNPSDPYVWINERIEQERARDYNDVEVIVSTYKDNPYLPVLQRAEIEKLQTSDPALWQVYGLGEYGKIEGLIYPDFTVIDALPDALAYRAVGLDFGFGADPAAAVLCGVQNKTDLYIHEIVYAHGLTNADLSAELARHTNKQTPVYADSAEPKSIEELRRDGWKIQGATKGADSVKHGIDIVRQHRLFVTAQSLNVIRELRKYKWAQDSAGRDLARPVDDFNHALDALRYYAVMTLSTARRALPKMR
jgi:phage terminase large subunit